MRKHRGPITRLAACVWLTLLVSCDSHRNDGDASDSQEQAALTTAMQSVIASGFWGDAPTEQEVENLVATIVSQPSGSIVFLGADRKIHSIGPAEAESYRLGRMQEVRFEDGIDPRSVKIDLLDYPGRTRARILEALPELLAEAVIGSGEESGPREPSPGEYQYILLFDRHKMEAYGVDLDDIRSALTGTEIARVDPEYAEGILVEISIGESGAADPGTLMDKVVGAPGAFPVHLYDVAIFRQVRATSER